ncbi:MAG: hypothetical protein MUC94_02825, partial [bacterium]|nr:hypothetical protein [bacterium]
MFKGLDDIIDISDITTEISYVYTNIVEDNVKEAFNNLPFDISHSNRSSFDTELDFSIEKIGEYIQKHNLKD